MTSFHAARSPAAKTSNARVHAAALLQAGSSGSMHRLLPFFLAAASLLPGGAAQAQTAAPAAPAAQIAPANFPAINGVTLKQFAFGVFRDLNTPTPGLDETLVVQRNNTAVGWVIKLDTSKPAVRWREEFTMPTPPQNWGLVAAKTDVRAPLLSADRRTATSERLVPVGVGDISHHWTLEPGDPAGAYSMRVWVEDILVATINFEAR